MPKQKTPFCGRQHFNWVKQFSGHDLEEGATPPDKVTRGHLTTWELDIGDDIIYHFRIPRNWYEGTNIYIRMAFLINENYAAANGEVHFCNEWEATKTDGTEVNGAGATGDDGSTDINIPATALSPYEITVGTIDGSNLDHGDLIGCQLIRDNLDDGTDPTADPEIIYIIPIYVMDFPTYYEVPSDTLDDCNGVGQD